MLADELFGFQVRIFSSHKSPSVRYQAQIMKNTLGMDIDVLPPIDHEAFVKIFSKARIYVGLSETDGLSTSMVEAMQVGAFPIQSQNSAASFFIQDAETGFIVDPWDIEAIRDAVLTGITDSRMIDIAATHNANRILSAYSRSIGIMKISELYASEH
jgi:glycosyltransferase involved in cell wall biosynthesis